MKKNDNSFESLEFQNALDSYFINLYEKGEMKTVKEMSEELGDISVKAIYKYIRYCCSDMSKARVLRCIMCTTKFGRSAVDYCNAQKQYLLKLERKKEAIMAAKKIYEKQQNSKKGGVK